MKSLRRSMNKDHAHISTPISTFPGPAKSAAFSQPPKKVIRCIRPYRSRSPQEVSSSVGDFLYVVQEVPRSDGTVWYEVTNPVNNSRGMVPSDCFEEVHKSAPSTIPAGPNARLPRQNIPSTRISGPISGPMNGRPPVPKHQTFYAIVQFDFAAERPDELDARAGEPISVVAQSNREWFVAKPIGRLGGPGLIPVSFVEIRDPVSNQPVRDVGSLMDRGILPRVEEWKQATADYKASSIPLGVLDDVSTGQVVKDSPFMRHAPPSDSPQPRIPSQHGSMATTSRAIGHDEYQPAPAASSDMLPKGIVLSATIPSFHFENDEYWFRIDATYQTEESPNRLLNLILYRNYDDFYEFQISLLDDFPVEAGRVPPQDHMSQNGYITPPASIEEESTRILPYMPGPVSYVDDMITSVRRTELDQYLTELVELDQRGAGHVLRCDLFRTFFSAKSGDVVEESDTAPEPLQPHSSLNKQAIAEEDDEEYDERYSKYSDGRGNVLDEVSRGMEQMRLNKQPQQPKHVLDSFHQNQSRSSAGSNYDVRTGAYRTSEYQQQQRNSRYSGADYDSGRLTPSRTNPSSRSRNSSPHKPRRMESTTTSSSRPPSELENQTLSPPIANSTRSSAEQAPSFLKIKIFHSQSDDLIAIRVPPRVTYTQLMSKVRDRLGEGVGVLRYRDSFDGKGDWREIGGDAALKDWILKGDKLVLYAD